MKIGLWQAVMLSIASLELVITALMHGKVKIVRYNIYRSMLSWALWLMILLFGGFFK